MNKSKIVEMFTKRKRKVPFSCRLPAEAVALIKHHAKEEGLSESDIVDICVRTTLMNISLDENDDENIEAPYESTSRSNQKTSSKKRSPKTK